MVGIVVIAPPIVKVISAVGVPNTGLLIVVTDVGKLSVNALLHPENALDGIVVKPLLVAVKVAKLLQPENDVALIPVIFAPRVTDDKGVLPENALFGINVVAGELIIRVVFPLVVPNALVAKLRIDVANKLDGKLSVNELLLQPVNAFAPTCTAELFKVTVAKEAHPETADALSVAILPPNITDFTLVLVGLQKLVGILVFAPARIKSVLALNGFPNKTVVLFNGK